MMINETFKMPRLFPRPSAQSSRIISWVATVDHKRIGIMYGFVSFFWFIVGGAEALLLRLQLSAAELNVLSPELYNQLFTMHGTTMIFLVVMPLSAAFFNLLIPLQIGARDVAFPRLNAFSLWVFVLGSIVLNLGWFFGEAPNGGWFGYAPNSESLFSPGLGMSFWAVGLNILGIASLAAALNFIVTVINMRAPGMSFFRLPIFTWMSFITAILTALALPVLTVALTQLMFDRIFGTNFYNPLAGSDPVLWQHMFWLFGHPEVYILILPAMGMVSEIIPTFSRKPLFGYQFMVIAAAAIAFMGWFVWSHHMFTVGLGPATNTAFAISTMAIAIPTGIKIFNWLGTMFRGSIRLNTPMLFAISFIAMFTIGGLSGVMHAVVPSDAQQQDTYFVVAHFHYVLFGGAMLGIFGGIYYWWPKFAGWKLNEKLGKWNFALTFIGFNLSFAPMHWVGLTGMPRRIYTYQSGYGWDAWNMVVTAGAFVLAIGVLLFIINIIVSARQKRKNIAGNDPWDGRTLEWSIPSPVPEHNFDEIPTVTRIDDYWYRKYPDERSKKSPPPVKGGAGRLPKIHLPDMSYYPLIVAIGVATLLGGLLVGIWLAAIGGVIVLWGLLGWAMEPVNAPAPQTKQKREQKLKE